MGIKLYKPTSAGRRFQSSADFSVLTRAKPEKSLLKALHKKGGRNNRGRITARHRGGGHKRRYRVIDFRRDKHGVPGKVFSIEYDPNRSGWIALIHYSDGEKRYILSPKGLEAGDQIRSGPAAEMRLGNALPLENITLGSTIHNIELSPGRGGQLARSAGVSAQLVAKEGGYAHVRLPSGEVRKIHLRCYATVGEVGNPDHENISLGKAGRRRWLGRRPHVRGVAMNPVDHPMGGGEGKSSGGRHPCTPWGVPTKGKKTRKKKPSDKAILKKRGRNR